MSTPSASAPAPNSSSTSASQTDRDRDRDARRASALHALTSGPSVPTILPPKVQILSSTVILAEKAQLTGTPSSSGLPASYTITINPRATVHPFAKVSGALAEVLLEGGCVIWEGASVGVEGKKGGIDSEIQGIRIGEQASVAAHAVVQSPAVVGAHTEIGTRAVLKAGCVVGEWCRIAPGVMLPEGTEVPPFTVVYHAQGRVKWRRNGTVAGAPNGERVRELMSRGHGKHADVCAKVVRVNLAKWT